MKKIIVIGCPGSGKSTFSRALHGKTKIPLYHLDMMYWRADKTTVTRQELVEHLQRIFSENEWIIDGNYATTMEMRIKECDTVFFLDLPTEVCLEGIKERRGKERSDMPCVLSDSGDDFIEFVKKYNTESRPTVIEMLEKYSDKRIVIFKSRDEINAFLKGLE